MSSMVFAFLTFRSCVCGRSDIVSRQPNVPLNDFEESLAKGVNEKINTKNCKDWKALQDELEDARELAKFLMLQNDNLMTEKDMLRRELDSLKASKTSH